jgi:SAM-dependent methyltransferase
VTSERINHDHPSPESYAARDLAALAARWDARAPYWDQELGNPKSHLNEDHAYTRFLREARREISRRRGFCRAHGVVDAGCGTGSVLAEVIGAFAWGIGVDISREMIRIALMKAIPKASFLVGDCFGLSAVCPKAGAVLSRGVLVSHYGPKHGTALLRAGFATLAPGGFFVFDFLNQAARDHNIHAPEDKACFLPQEIREMARRAGFSSVTITAGPERRVLVAAAQRD